MSKWRLILRSLAHYRWTNLSVLVGVALTSAVLSGALVVGDSVRESLRRHADARISNVGPIIVGGERMLSAALADRLQGDLGDDLGGEKVAPVLIVEATASNRAGGKRANRVQIVGVDERFWGLSLGGAIPGGFEDERWIGINESLAKQLDAKVGDTLIARVELPGSLSKDAPLSGESEQTVPFTAKVSSMLGPSEFGLFSLRAEQVPPATLFVRRERLERALELENRANLFLAGKSVEAEALRQALGNRWDLDDVQLKVAELGGGKVKQAISSRVFFDAAMVEAIESVSSEVSPVLTYLAIDIENGDRATPYSMITAVGDELNEIVDGELNLGEIILSRWLADDFNAKPGDTVSVVYDVVGQGRKLIEKRAEFTVKSIAAIGEAGWDQSWTPEFPGIFDVDDLDEWEPGIPIDRSKIRDKDDEYWDEYRATPKAFVSLATGQELWANRFGNATAIRFVPTDERTPLVDQLRSHLDLNDLGIEVRDLPNEAANAVSASYDFGSLFASMSFFLIVAALVLAGMVFAFGVEQRASQIGLLLASGWTPRAVRRLFSTEVLILAVVGAALGLLGGVVYTKLALWGMSGIWQEAASGIALVYHLKPATLMMAFGLTIGFSLLVVFFSTRRISAIQPSQLVSGSDESLGSSKRRLPLDWIICLGALLGGLGCLFAPKVPGTMAEQGMFYGAGFMLLVAGVAACSILIRRLLRPADVLTSLGALGRQGTARRRGRSLAVIGLMAAGVFMVTAINAFRLSGERGAERRDSGTGGFAYVGESTLPIYEDLNGQAGREKYGLDGFEEVFEVVPFRVSAGDDASCLNLNRAQRPRLMGLNVAQVIGLDPFSFTKQMGEEDRWRLLSRELKAVDGLPVIPGVIDQNTATYSLKKGLGDLVAYETAAGEAFAVQLVGFLDTSVLQGNILISEQHFIQLFPDAGGYRYFFLDSGSDQSLDAVASHLTRMFGDLGLAMRPTADRLNEFNAVQNTYLSIFSTLGGLGILLGTVGLAVVVGRNVMERRGPLGVMQAMGFSKDRLSALVLAEHWFLHVLGVVLGFVCAMIAVFPQLASSAGRLPWGLLLGMSGAILVCGLAFCWVAARVALKDDLIEAIREE